MKKKLLLSFFALMIVASSYSQVSLWRQVTSDKVEALPKTDRRTTPVDYKIFSLDFASLKQQLQSAPLRGSGNSSDLIIAFPSPDGKLQQYRIYEASVMAPELAARFPDNKSYVGTNLSNPTESIRFSTTMYGLHTMSFGSTGVSYIDTYTTDLLNYIVYDKSQLTDDREFECHAPEVAEEISANRQSSALIGDGIFRTYRLAMASTVEYSAFHVNAAGLNSGTLDQKKAAVLAAMNVTMTRVNGIYERDMSLTMVLVPNNDQIIFIDSDNFTNDSADDLLNESQMVINAIIGIANYDIGHTVSTGAGGKAQINSPCTSNRARGVTGSSSPVGDTYDVDYVAHEMGHQFGANHTFNNSCGGNRNGGTAVEPGSGSTIMGYAGICAPDVQNTSDAHFHAISIAEMTAFVTGTGTCSTNILNGNAAPVVNAGADFIIPNGTAFILKGTAVDLNGDALTYSWEQIDNEISTQAPLATSTTGPNFESQVPSASPNRYMPSFSSVLANNLTPTWEVVPSVARTMEFSLTVRDNNTPNGGQTGRDDKLITTAAVGPFRVTNPSVENVTWTQNTAQNITWDVAGTTGNGINTAAVNILYSSDAGATFTTLVANTPNDGTETITVPNIASPYNRIMIESIGNIFYAVSKSFAVGYTVTVTNTCTPYTATPNAALSGSTSTGFTGYSLNIPDSVTITDLNIGVNITHARINDLRIGVAIPGSAIVNRFLYDRNCGSFGTPPNLITTFDDEGAAFSCAGAAGNNNYIAPMSSMDYFDGMNSQGVWRLAVADAAATINGTLNSFTFTVCSTSTVVTLATQNFGFDEFVVYPNPSNGNFNIQFNQSTSDGVKVLVHDMRGRLIYENAYSASGTFNENIQLKNAQTGVYLLTVTDGDRKEVKRIIVE